MVAWTDVLQADPRLGRLLAAIGLCRIPEEARLPDQPEYSLLFGPLASAALAGAASGGSAE